MVFLNIIKTISGMSEIFGSLKYHLQACKNLSDFKLYDNDIKNLDNSSRLIFPKLWVQVKFIAYNNKKLNA